MQHAPGSLPPVRRPCDVPHLNLSRKAGYSYGSPVRIDIRGQAPSLPFELRSTEVQRCYVGSSFPSYSSPLNCLHVMRARSSTVFRGLHYVVFRGVRHPKLDPKVEGDFCWQSRLLKLDLYSKVTACCWRRLINLCKWKKNWDLNVNYKLTYTLEIYLKVCRSATCTTEYNCSSLVLSLFYW